MLKLQILGPPIIERDGRRLKLPKKAAALLVYLTMRGEPIGRDILADLLWPHLISEHARHSLRNGIYELHKEIGPEVLTGDHPNCWIAPDSVESDLSLFTALSSGRLEDLRRACNLVRGPLLEGFFIPAGPWNEWLEFERERTRLLVSAALSRLAQLSTAVGLHDDAIVAATRLAALDPLDEPAARLLMIALARGGRRTQALAQYRRLTTTLRDELAVGPEPETERLAAALTHY